jgi:hypothetical protein
MENLRKLMVETIRNNGKVKIDVCGSDLFDCVPVWIDHGSEFQDLDITIEVDGDDVTISTTGEYVTFWFEGDEDEEEESSEKVETVKLDSLNLLQLSFIIQNLNLDPISLV